MIRNPTGGDGGNYFKPVSESLPLLGFVVAEERPDRLFHSDKVYSAVDIERGRLVAARQQPFAPPSAHRLGPAYLGTVYFAAPSNASGEVVIAFHPNDSLLRDAEGGPVAWELPRPGTLMTHGR